MMISKKTEGISVKTCSCAPVLAVKNRGMTNDPVRSRQNSRIGSCVSLAFCWHYVPGPHWTVDFVLSFAAVC
jgi:hypothetical protein